MKLLSKYFWNIRYRECNYRNHRKFVLIDGRYGYLGGFNVGKEYKGEGPLGYWRVYYMKITGEAFMKSRKIYFRLDIMYKENLSPLFAEYFKEHEDIELGHKVPMQIISSGLLTKKQNT